MILILKPSIDSETPEYKQLETHLARLQNIKLRVHQVQGAEQTLTEIYLIGNTATLSIQEMKNLPGVDHVVRVSEEYRILGRHKDDHRFSNIKACASVRILSMFLPDYARLTRPKVSKR
jgi:3-deoxy-7-phosphoheptulonate synthase